MNCERARGRRCDSDIQSILTETCKIKMDNKFHYKINYCQTDDCKFPKQRTELSEWEEKKIH